ncbi:periplasmic heavy metal sensor [Candidatus Saganbacteria bacterium]|nr:periplasmic heavy metal sensor [Candidatus Saganbacteria bacterium]
MIRKYFLAILLITVVLSGISLGVPLFGPPRDKDPMAERMIERMAKDIGLTQQQKDKFLSGAKQIEEEAKEIHSKNKELFDKIEKEILKESPDSKAIYGNMQLISRNMTQIQFKRMDQIIQLRKELTPEQKAKLEKIIRGRKEREKKMFEKIRQKDRKDRGSGGPEGPLGPGGPEGVESK